ncbi:MAG: RdgB/HAM1 family non-canonical purine NTP pyrophosphatase [Steroidobacteraceae bacterium]
MRVVIASGNPGKLRELEALLAPRGWDLVAQGRLGIESAPETGTTFEANALIKARHASRAAQLPAIADDSGIEVDALGGRPGVRSARYAGERASDGENLALLLRALEGMPPERRTARYRCVIAYVSSPDDPHPILGAGCWEGSIALAPRGSGGFGYDPIFLPLDGNRTAAELEPPEKRAVSHRTHALAAFLSQLGT